jgi:undecaprenyl-diphosphatase
MRRRPSPWLLVLVAVTAMLVFVALTVVLTTTSTHALDSSAFEVADDVRAPWLDTVAKIVTQLGLIAIVGPAVVVGALILIRGQHLNRATALVGGAALTWVSVWITKAAVDRPRPPHPLVHTSGQSYPSAHAANSVGWLALAIALTVVIPGRRTHVAAVTVGALLAVLVGLSRIYLRAHYASDVVAGEALAVAMYAVASICVDLVQRRHGQASATSQAPSHQPGAG